MSNTIRFSGLSSGMDTEAVVKALVLPYQNKVDTAKQDKQLLEWKKDAYKEMNTKISSFYNNYIYKMSLQGTFNKTKVSVSNPNIIKMDQNAVIPEGNHTVKVENMASGAIVSTKTIQGATKQTTLGEINGDLPSEFSMTVGTGSNAKTINVGITDDMTIEHFELAVKNALSDEGIDNVSFKFDEKSSAFIASTTKTGASQQITMNEDSLKVLNATGVTQGQDAKIIYNGGVEVTSSTNKIEVNGLAFNIAGTSNETITISSAKDTDGMIDFVKGFVEEYNKLVEEINSKLQADSAKGYKPLTDAQKEEMSEKQIEKWEEKIKNSLLRNDSTLRDISSMMRQTLGQAVGDGAIKMLSDLGITTGEWRERGKLHIDEDKLRKAITEDSSSVAEFLNGLGKTLDKQFKEKLSTTNDVKSYNSLFNDKLLTQSIQSKEKTIIDAEARLTRMEDMYYKRFTAMEKMLNQYNSQSTWLSQQLGGTR